MKTKLTVFTALIIFVFSAQAVKARDFSDCLFNFCDDKPKPTVTVTPTPTPTPTPTSTPTPTPSNNDNSTPSNGGRGGDPGCNDQAPDSAPKLLSVTDMGGGKVNLKWSSVSPVDHYAIAYGGENGKYSYGQTNVGNITNYIVASLEVGKRYCFVVSAVNGCKSSGFSNELCNGQVRGASIWNGGGQVLGLSSTSSGDYRLFGLLCVSAGLFIILKRKKLPKFG